MLVPILSYIAFIIFFWENQNMEGFAISVLENSTMILRGMER